jgi:hypothetical protein
MTLLSDATFKEEPMASTASSSLGLLGENYGSDSD